MSTQSFQIRSVSRLGTDDVEDTLRFDSGVNVIVGQPNTGKSRWLETIDLLMGDDEKVEDKLSERVAENYSRAWLILDIGGEEITVERRWMEAGVKTKVFVNDQAMSITGYRQFLLDRIGIPSLHYPSGDPYSPRKWPELGWRSLFRHMYRRQEFWSAIADKQFPPEQHACILQFAGVAENLFTREYGELVTKEKRIRDLQAQQENFLRTLHEVSRDILTGEDLGIEITSESVNAAIEQLDDQVAELHKKRDEVIQKLMANLSGPLADAPDSVSRLSKEFAELKESERKHVEELERVDSRLVELEVLQQRVAAETGRLERAQKAGDVLAGLKVTHCPVCDQSVKKPAEKTQDCFLCHQPYPTALSIGEPLQRLEFELEQLRGEQTEVEELKASLTKRRSLHSSAIRNLRARGSQIKDLLTPSRLATMALMPPQVSELDMEIGRFVERVDQLRRIGNSLALRARITDMIRPIEKEVEELQEQVSLQTARLDFTTSSDALSAGMNEYVSQLVSDGKEMWTQGRIEVTLNKDSFRLRVNRHKWESQLGGTMRIYFLLAYHYSLLKLSSEEGSRVPGFLLLDFPATIEGEQVAGHENFAIEPFITLCKKDEYSHVQVIAAGSAFDGLTGTKRMRLEHVWR